MLTCMHTAGAVAGGVVLPAERVVAEPRVAHAPPLLHTCRPVLRPAHAHRLRLHAPDTRDLA